MNNKTVVIGGIIILIIVAVLLNKKETWMGFYYPEGNLVVNTVYSPTFETKEDCIRWAENIWESRPSDRDINPQNLYECGKNCKLENARLGLYKCDVTFDGGDWRRGDYGD